MIGFLLSALSVTAAFLLWWVHDLARDARSARADALASLARATAMQAERDTARKEADALRASFAPPADQAALRAHALRSWDEPTRRRFALGLLTDDDRTAIAATSVRRRHGAIVFEIGADGAAGDVWREPAPPPAGGAETT